MKRNTKGFTLVEVLIAVGVLAVASLAFLPSFTGSYKKKNLQNAQETVKDDIATTRSKALAETGISGAATTYKYSGIKFARDSGTYYLFRSNEATASICGSIGTNNADSVKSLPSGMVAKIESSPNENPTCIFFEYKTGATLITKGTADAKTCLD